MVAVEDVIAEPSVELLQQCTKTVLVAVAKALDLPVRSSMRKPEVRNIVIEYLVDENRLDEAALTAIVEIPGASNDKDMEMQFRLEQMRMELENERERAKLEHERERERDWRMREI